MRVWLVVVVGKVGKLAFRLFTGRGDRAAKLAARAGGGTWLVNELRLCTVLAPLLSPQDIVTVYEPMGRPTRIAFDSTTEGDRVIAALMGAAARHQLPTGPKHVARRACVATRLVPFAALSGRTS